MTTLRILEPSFPAALRVALARFSVALVFLVLAACGDRAVPLKIAQQPASLTVSAGQPASFTVAATGAAPLAYQWQHNGVAIAGATGAK